MKAARRLGISWLVIVLTASTPLPVFSQQPDTQARADDLFRQGREAMTREDFRRALELLRASQELDPGSGTLLNIAICEERLGELTAALAHFEEVAAQLARDDARRAIVESSLASLPARLPRLRIDLAPGAPAETRVTLDGSPVERDALGADRPVDPGKHVITVAAAGRPEKRYEVTAEEGKRAAVSVEPGAALDVPGRSLVPAGVLVGIGVVGLGAGLTFLGLREGKRSEATELRRPILDGGGSCIPDAANFDGARCPALAEAASAGDTFGTVSVAGFVVAGLAAAGTLTYLLWPGPGKGAPAAVSIRITPVVGVREQSVFFSGSF